MCLLIQAKIMTIEGGHLVLTGLGIVIPVILMLIGFERSRRKDLQKHLKQKASVIYVDSQIGIQDKKISKHEVDLRYKIKSTMEAHEKVHTADRGMLKQMQTDLTIIKEHLINK